MANTKFLNPSDYLTLNTRDCTFKLGKLNNISGGAQAYSHVIMEWDVPHDVFSQERGPLCTVQVTSGFIAEEANNPSAISFHWMGGSANAHAINQPEVISNVTHTFEGIHPLIGVFGMKGNNGCHTLENSNEIVTSTPSNKIRILATGGFYKNSNIVGFGIEQIDTVNKDTFFSIFSLKFTYYDSEVAVATQKNNINYNVL